MKREIISVAMLLLTLVGASAQNYTPNKTVRMWDNSTAPHSNNLSGAETSRQNMFIGNTSEAVLYIYDADPTKATGQSIVICPGGGYQFVSMENEGHKVAEWFAANGITAAILKYRMPNGHREVPLEDAVEALRTMRRYATQHGGDAAQVGIIGFSAGGHLAASASTLADDTDKPAFSVLVYPVITGERGKCHEGSFDNLLGKGRTDAQTAEYSLQNRVTATTPPTILLLSDDDVTVPVCSSTYYYNALKENGIKASMHIYPSGGHGWGFKESFRYKKEWTAALLEWLAGIRPQNTQSKN